MHDSLKLGKLRCMKYIKRKKLKSNTRSTTQDYIGLSKTMLSITESSGLFKFR